MAHFIALFKRWIRLRREKKLFMAKCSQTSTSYFLTVSSVFFLFFYMNWINWLLLFPLFLFRLAFLCDFFICCFICFFSFFRFHMPKSIVSFSKKKRIQCLHYFWKCFANGCALVRTQIKKNKQFFSRFILDSVRIIHQNRRTSNAFNIFFNNNISNAFRIILFPYLSLTKWSLEIVEVSIHRSLIENWISWNSSMSIIWKIQTIKRKKSLKWLTILPNLLSKLRNKKDGKRASAFYWTEIRFNARFVKRYQHWQCIFFFFTLCCYCLFLIANVRAVATAISVKALKIYHLTHAHFQFGISGKQKEKREQKTNNRQW